MNEGIIELDSSFANKIGFTSDKFEGYLWCHPKENTIIISTIESKQEGTGNLMELFQNIWILGFKIEVPTPSVRMKSILKRHNFVPGIVNDHFMGPLEVWTK